MRSSTGWSERRGAAAIIVMILGTVLVGGAAFSVDLGQLMMFRTQLRAATDAAALAAAQRLAAGYSGSAASTGATIGSSYKVGATPVVMAPEQVVPVCWDWSTSTGTTASPCDNWGYSGVNGAQATASYTASYTLGKVMGFSSNVRTAVSVAAVGSSSNANGGLRPWTIAYIDLLKAIDKKACGACTTRQLQVSTYNLTQADFALIASMGVADSVAFLDDVISPGNIGKIDVGGGNYTTQVLGGGTTNIALNTWIYGTTGQGNGATKQPLQTLCNGGNANNFTCTNAPRVSIVIYDQTNGLSGANLQVHIKYLVGLELVGFQKQGGNYSIDGYFTTVPVAGNFTTAPSGAFKLALVK